MPKTKKFIDKKRSVAFNLVHGSQKDPLVADETAPQRVLVPVHVPEAPKKDKEPDLTPEKRLEEQRKFGIYFDDDYNYLQHLKDTNEVTMLIQPKPVHKRKLKATTTDPEEPEEDEETPADRIQLPSSVFASEVEEDVGMLNKAAPQGLRLDLDPDVVAALDEDFDFDDPDNELEDNFMELAMAEGEDFNEDDEYDADGDDDDDGEELDSDDDEEGATASGGSSDRCMPAYNVGDTESEDNGPSKPRRALTAKEQMSKYSHLSSAHLPRTELQQILDRRFDKFYEQHYDDSMIGGLEDQEIHGPFTVEHDVIQQALADWDKSQQKVYLDKDPEIAKWSRMQKFRDIKEGSDESDLELRVIPAKPKYDCKSILTKNPNTKNQPTMIEEPKKQKKIKINPKTGLPADVLGKDDKLTVRSLARFDEMQGTEERDIDEDRKTMLSTLSALSIRPKDESTEEKRDRKRLLKEYRKERRIEKKANKDAFKEEKKRQEKIRINNINNVQGNRIL